MMPDKARRKISLIFGVTYLPLSLNATVPRHCAEWLVQRGEIVILASV